MSIGKLIRFDGQSIIQYNNSMALSRRHASHVLSIQLRRRRTAESESPTSSLKSLYTCHVLPDVESSSLNVARSLLPVVRKLKWSIQKDKLARVFKNSGMHVGVGAWLEGSDGAARKVLPEDEKVRLAVCPDIRKALGFFERLGRS